MTQSINTLPSGAEFALTTPKESNLHNPNRPSHPYATWLRGQKKNTFEENPSPVALTMNQKKKRRMRNSAVVRSIIAKKRQQKYGKDWDTHGHEALDCKPHAYTYKGVHATRCIDYWIKNIFFEQPQKGIIVI